MDGGRRGEVRGRGTRREKGRPGLAWLEEGSGCSGSMQDYGQGSGGVRAGVLCAFWPGRSPKARQARATPGTDRCC